MSHSVVQYLARNSAPADKWLAKFDRERERLLPDYRCLTALVVWLARDPASFLAALEVTRRLPRLFSHFLGVAGSTRRLWSAPLAQCPLGLAVQRKICQSLLKRKADES